MSPTPTNRTNCSEHRQQHNARLGIGQKCDARPAAYSTKIKDWLHLATEKYGGLNVAKKEEGTAEGALVSNFVGLDVGDTEDTTTGEVNAAALFDGIKGADNAFNNIKRSKSLKKSKSRRISHKIVKQQLSSCYIE